MIYLLAKESSTTQSEQSAKYTSLLKSTKQIYFQLSKNLDPDQSFNNNEKQYYANTLKNLPNNSYNNKQLQW